MTVYPFDFVQYCVTDEPLVGVTPSTRTVTPGGGETYIGLYNFNPGFNGTIKTISFKTTVPWLNPTLVDINGVLFLKAKKYNEPNWTIIDQYNFNNISDASGEVDFSTILVSGESDLIPYVNEVPLLVAITGYILSGQEEELGAELIANYDFSSGETDWTMLNSNSAFNYVSSEILYLKSGVYPNYATPSPGATSASFSVNTVNRYKLNVDVDYHFQFASLVYSVSGETQSGVILGDAQYDNGASYTGYITFTNSNDKAITIKRIPSFNETRETHINSVSLKEVTQEKITVDDLTISRQHLIVRCMGETI